MKIKPEIFTRLLAIGFTQRQIADAMGISYQAIWARQRNNSWKPEHIEGFVGTIKRKFGVVLDVLEVVE